MSSLGVGVKLNLGCGEYYARGWVNVDLNDEARVKPDRVVDVTCQLPADVGTVERIYAGHLLEHIKYDRVVAMLNLWYSYMRPGGLLLVVGPDCDRARRWVRSGMMSQNELDGMGVNGTPGTGYAHLWEATETNTLELLDASAWRQPRTMLIDTVPTSWPLTSHIGWQFAIMARA